MAMRWVPSGESETWREACVTRLVLTPRLHCAMADEQTALVVDAVDATAAGVAAAGAGDGVATVFNPQDAAGQTLLLLGGLSGESLQRKRHLGEKFKEFTKQQDKTQKDMRLERRREERLVDRAKRRSVASLTKRCSRRAWRRGLRQKRTRRQRPKGWRSQSDIAERCNRALRWIVLPTSIAQSAGFLVWLTSTLTSIREFTYKPSICSPFNLTSGV